MRERVTNKHLEFELNSLNEYYGIHGIGWDTPGIFVVQAANGGYQLQRNIGGGFTNISKRGTKREIYDQLCAINKVLETEAHTVNWLERLP